MFAENLRWQSGKKGVKLKKIILSTLASFFPIIHTMNFQNKWDEVDQLHIYRT